MEKLNEIEIKSALWLKIEAWANGQIDLLRKRNDGDLDNMATAKLRGKISALKALLDLAQPDPTITNQRP